MGEPALVFRHCEPPNGGRGNPAFLLSYLPDCFLDGCIWIASLRSQ